MTFQGHEVVAVGQRFSPADSVVLHLPNVHKAVFVFPTVLPVFKGNADSENPQTLHRHLMWKVKPYFPLLETQARLWFIWGRVGNKYQITYSKTITGLYVT